MSNLSIAGQSGYSNRVRKFARIESFNGSAVMWDGANGGINQPDYQGWLESESIITAVSTSTEDAVGGGGAYALQVRGQGEDGIEKLKIIILEGTNPVDSVDKFNIIYSAQVINLDAITNGNTSPISGANTGLVRIVSKTEPLRVMAAIIAHLGRTQMAVWRCPKNKYAEFKKLGVYPESNKPIIAQLWARGSIQESWINVGQIDQDNFLVEPEWPAGSEEYLAPGTDLCLTIITNSATSVSSLLWVNLFDIRNYDSQLKAEQERE